MCGSRLYSVPIRLNRRYLEPTVSRRFAPEIAVRFHLQVSFRMTCCFHFDSHEKLATWGVRKVRGEGFRVLDGGCDVDSGCDDYILRLADVRFNDLRSVMEDTKKMAVGLLFFHVLRYSTSAACGIQDKKEGS